MPKPICVKCALFFRPKNNDFYWEEGRPVGVGSDKEWVPYKLWAADLWQCRGCGTEIVVGHGHGPISEHFKPDYAAIVAKLRPALRVNDC